MRPDELLFVVRRSRRIAKESSSKRTIRLVPVFMLETHNQTNYKCFTKLVQTDISSSSIKATIHHFISNHLFRVSYEPTHWPVGLFAQLPRALHWQKLRIQLWWSSLHIFLHPALQIYEAHTFIISTKSPELRNKSCSDSKYHLGNDRDAKGRVGVYSHTPLIRTLRGV